MASGWLYLDPQSPQGRHLALVSLIFIGSMSSLFGSIIAFIRDINLSLHALKLELETVRTQSD